MNRPLTPSLSPSDGERVAEGRVRGGSWSQCMRKSERGLSMNLTSVGTSRCDVLARESAGGIVAPLNAARTAQRAAPTRFRGSMREVLFRGGLSINQRNIQHRTPNAEHRMAARILAHFGVRSSMLDIRCFPSAQGLPAAHSRPSRKACASLMNAWPLGAPGSETTTGTPRSPPMRISV